MLQVKEDILTKIMRAPVNLFFDVTPNSVIMHRFNGQIHELAGVTHRALWILRETISIFISIFLICQQNYWLSLVIPVFIYQVYSINGFARRSYKEMGRFIDKGERERGIASGELFSGAKMIRVMGSQKYAMEMTTDGYNTHFLTW
jgi:ABC-type multidrug transport system fused ATPase/permease subunit